MSRIPTVGGDANNWGTVLTDFLGVSHNADGTLKNTPSILGASATGWSHTGDTVEAKLTSVQIPAGVMGASGQLEIITVWDVPNNTNTKTLFIRFGAANDLTGTPYQNTGQTTTRTLQLYNRIANRGTGSQIGHAATVSVFGGSAGTPVTSSVDTTGITYVVFSAQCVTSGTDTINLDSYIVRFIPGV